MRKGICRRVLVATATAATAAFAVPAAPVQAAESCHPPRYDTLHCVCVAVGTVWNTVTNDDQWACSDPDH